MRARSVLGGVSARYQGMSLPVRAALWFTVAGVAVKGIATLSTPIFTRLMTTEQFGLYSLYNSWLQVLGVITTFRLAAAVFNKGMSKYPEGRNAFTATMQTVSTVLVLLFAALYVTLHEWADSATGLSALIIAAMFAELLLTPSVNFWTARERYDFRYRPVVFATMLMSAGAAVFGVIAVVLFEDKGTARIIAGAAVHGVIGLYIYIRNLRRGGTAFVAEHARFALTFNLPLIPHYVSMYVLDTFDRIMVAGILGLSAAGVYTVGYTAGAAIRVATDSIASALIPWLYRQLGADNLETIRRRLGQIFMMYGLLVLIFVAVAPEFVALLGGKDYVGAVKVVPPIAVSTFFIFAYMIFGNVEIYYDAKKMMMYGSAVTATANVALNYVLISRLGYVAAAYTTLVCYMGLALVHYIYMRGVVSRNTGGGRVFDTRQLFGVSLGLMVFSGLLIAIYGHPFARYTLLAAATVALVARRDTVKSLMDGYRS